MSNQTKRGRVGTCNVVVELLESRQLLTTYSMQLSASPTSQTVARDFSSDTQTATVTFLAHTTFAASSNDSDDYVSDVSIDIDTDGGTVTSSSASGLDGSDTSFSTEGELGAADYSVTATIQWNNSNLGIKHVTASGTISTENRGSKSYSATQTVTIPAGSLDMPGIEDGQKLTTGALVDLNNNDTDQNGVLDNHEMFTPGEEDLVPITLSASNAGGDYQLDFTDSGAAQAIKVWARPDKSVSDGNDHIVGGSDIYRIGSDTTIIDASQDTTLWVEGFAPGADTISLRWKGSAQNAPYNIADEIEVTVFGAQIKVDSNNDGAINDDDAAVANDPTKPGLVIPVYDSDNNDFDDELNGRPDILPADYLREADLSVSTTSLSGTVELQVGGAGAGNISVFSDSNGTQPLSQTQWTIGSQPSQVWIGATGASTALADVTLGLTMTPDDAPVPSKTQADGTATKLSLLGIGDANAQPVGFDLQPNGTKWLMVPQTVVQPPLLPQTGKNSAIVLVSPAAMLGQLNLDTTVHANAKVLNTAALPAGQQVPPNTGGEIVTVEGLVHSQNSILQATVGNKVLDQVHLDVKTPKTKTVAIFRAVDPREGINGNGIPLPTPPAANDLQTYLTNAFTHQAAINIQVLPLVDLNVQWDNLDGVIKTLITLGKASWTNTMR